MAAITGSYTDHSPQRWRLIRSLIPQKNLFYHFRCHRSAFSLMGLVPKTKVRILEEVADTLAHGYLLAERLDLSHGYIYTHLKELREAKMIEVVEEDDGRKVYGLTENGGYLLKALTGTNSESV